MARPNDNHSHLGFVQNKARLYRALSADYAGFTIKTILSGIREGYSLEKVK
jgi:hypothetical protein